jgi:hypothetical protein
MNTFLGPYSQHFILFATYEWAQNGRIDRPFQPSLMFVCKAEVYPNETPFMFSTLGQTPGLIHKH